MKKQRTPTKSEGSLGSSYLAMPFTKLNKGQQKQAIASAAKAVEMLINHKVFVICPVLHNYEPYKLGKLPIAFDFWKGYNFWLIDHCERLIVLTIKSWDDSTGVYEECQYAKFTNKQILYFNPDTYHVTIKPTTNKRPNPRPNPRTVTSI
jgi:hypothetical protein